MNSPRILFASVVIALSVLSPDDAWSQQASQTQQTQQYQFGYLGYKNVLQNMPEYAAAQQSLNNLREKYDKEAQYNEEKFKKMFADFLDGQKNFPQEIMLKRQKELQVAMEQGVSFRKEAERLLNKAEDEMMQPLIAKLDSALALIGQENGLIFILNTDNKDFPFIHHQAGKDLTDIVKARLAGKVIPLIAPFVDGQSITAPVIKDTEEPIP